MAGIGRSLPVDWLREEPRAKWSAPPLGVGRWRFKAGDGHTMRRLDRAAYRHAEQYQRHGPYLIGRYRGRQWWWYGERFYSDRAVLIADDVAQILSDPPASSRTAASR
jgi:hypothetical protein